MTRALASAVIALALLWAVPSSAQNSDNPECLGTSAASPRRRGGGCGCGCGCSVWVAYTDDGKTLAYTDDADGDGKADDNGQLPLRLQPRPGGRRRRRRGRRLRQLPGARQLQPARHRRRRQGRRLRRRHRRRRRAQRRRTTARCVPNADQTQHRTATPQGDVCDPTTTTTASGRRGQLPAACANPDQAIPADAAPVQRGHRRRQRRRQLRQLPRRRQPEPGGHRRRRHRRRVRHGHRQRRRAEQGPGQLPAPCANRDQLDDDGDGVGDACDAQYCVVVDPTNPDDCLDPKRPFTVTAAGS